MIRSVPRRDGKNCGICRWKLAASTWEEGVSSTTRAGDSLKQIIRMSEEVAG